jgi:translation initiation factor 6
VMKPDQKRRKSEGLLGKCDLTGSPYIGIFCACNNDVALIPHDAPAKFEKTVRKYLEVEPIRITIGGSRLIGALVAMNSHGLILSSLSLPEEINSIKKLLGGKLAITEIDAHFNAFGNTILSNDYGAIIHPGYSDEVLDVVSETLGVKVVRGKIANMELVGSCGVANSRGALLHPKSTPEERKLVSETLRVRVNIATANLGCPYLRSSLLVNDHGTLIGSMSTTVEIDRVFDTLC